MQTDINVLFETDTSCAVFSFQRANFLKESSRCPVRFSAATNQRRPRQVPPVLDDIKLVGIELNSIESNCPSAPAIVCLEVSSTEQINQVGRELCAAKTEKMPKMRSKAECCPCCELGGRWNVTTQLLSIGVVVLSPSAIIYDLHLPCFRFLLAASSGHLPARVRRDPFPHKSMQANHAAQLTETSRPRPFWDTAARLRALTG